MYEHRKQPLLTREEFARRVGGHVLLGFSILVSGLGIGVLGYHFIANLSWVNAILDASMILAGMGQVNPLLTTRAKLFASFYALLSGGVFIGVAGIVLAPFTHRMLHRVHLE